MNMVQEYRVSLNIQYHGIMKAKTIMKIGKILKKRLLSQYEANS